MGKAAPTKHALDFCSTCGWMATVVERRLGPRTFDAFGFGDILVVQPGKRGSLLVQVTTTSHVRDRQRKITEKRADEAKVWLNAHNRIEVWGYKGAELKVITAITKKDLL